MPVNGAIKDVADLHKEVGPDRMIELIEQHVRPVEPLLPDKRRQPLTIRNIGEILEMTFDDNDMVLENGYLTLGERSAICGMGGVGKSRLVMQLALCCRAAREFLGWHTR